MDKILDTISPLQGILKNASGILKSVSTTITSIGKAVNKEAMGDMVLKFAEAIAIVIGAIVVLANVKDLNAAKKAADIVGYVMVALAASLGILTAALSLLNKGVNPAIYVSMMLSYMGIIAAITLFLVAATAMVSVLSKDGVSLGKGITFLVVVLAGLAGVLFAITRMAVAAKDSYLSIALMTAAIKAIGKFILEAAIAMKIVGTMDDDAYTKGTTFIVAMGVFLGALMLVSHFSKDIPERMEEFGKAMQSIGIAMILAAISLKIIGSMDDTAFKRGVKFFKWFGIFIAAMVIITDNRGISESIDKFGKMMSSIGLAMILAAVSLKIIGSMSGDELAKGLIFMNSFFGFVLLMTLITNEGKKSIDGFAKLMRSLGISLILMAVAVKILGGMDVGAIVKGEAAVTGLAGIMWLLIKSMKGMEKEAPKIAAVLLTATICIALLAGVVFLVGQLSPETLKKGVATVGALSLMVAALIAVTKLAQSSPDMPKVLLQISLMIAMLVASMAILILIADDVHDILTVAEALALVVASLGVVIASTSKLKVEAGMWKTVALIAGLLAAIGLVLGLLSKFGGDAKSMIAAGAALSEVLISLSISMAILSALPEIDKSTLANLAIMGAILGEVGFIVGALNKLGLTTTIDQAIALGILINALSIALIPLGEAGKAGFKNGLTGIGILEALIASTVLVIEGLGALFNWIDKDGANFKRGAELLVDLGGLIGEFFGEMLASFGEALLILLPDAGTALSDFYNNAKVFIDGMSKVKPSVAQGAEALANALLKITAGEALNIIVSALTAGSTLSGDILKQRFTAIAEGLLAFSSTLGDFSESDAKKIAAAADSAKSLSDFVNGLPPEGGLKQSVLGSVDFDEFIRNLKKFGPVLKDFSLEARHMDSGAIGRAVEAAQGLSDFANSLPTYDGIKAAIMGDKITIEEFGDQLKDLAKGLSGFYAELSGDKAINVNVVKSAVNAAKGLSDLANSLPSTNGIFNEWFGGTLELDVFGDQLADLGRGLSRFSKTSKDIDAGAMDIAVKAVKDLAEISVALSQGDFSVFGTDSLESLGEDLIGLGENLVAFNNSVTTLSSQTSNLSYVIDNLKKLVEAIQLMQGVDYEYMYSFKDALNAMAQFDMAGLVRTYSVQGISDIGRAGEQLVNSLISGLQKGDKPLTDTVSMLMTSALNQIHLMYHYYHDSGYEITEQMRSGIRMGEAGLVYETKGVVNSAQWSINDYYQYFITAGAHLMNGLLEGMASKEDELITRAGQIAAQTLKVMQSGFEEKSPSKATERMGRYLDEGLINGMKKYSRQVYSTAETLSTKTLDGFSKSIDQIYEVIDADLNPVITPTINLDYVKQGVSDINSMFNAKSLNANAELQNGVDMNGAGGPTISFTQINNSPKALSRIDIYRQTRNQIAQMKGALN